jgi:hypothetical protein
MTNGGLAYHVTPQDSLWKVSLPGDSQPESLHEDRDEAIAYAASLAVRLPAGRLVIHRADGTIEHEETLGPLPPATASGAPRS